MGDEEWRLLVKALPLCLCLYDYLASRKTNSLCNATEWERSRNPVCSRDRTLFKTSIASIISKVPELKLLVVFRIYMHLICDMPTNTQKCECETYNWQQNNSQIELCKQYFFSQDEANSVSVRDLFILKKYSIIIIQRTQPYIQNND